MNRPIALAVACLFFFPSAPANGARQPLTWLAYGEAVNKAAGADRLIVVDVYTDWCGWCKKLDADVYSRDDIRSYLNATFIPVKLNAEDRESSVTIGGEPLTYAQLAAAYGVRSYPTTLFLMPDGKLIYALRGYHPPEQFLKALKYFGEKHYLQDIAKRASEDTD